MMNLFRLQDAEAVVSRRYVSISREQCFFKLAKGLSEGAAFARELVQNAFDASDKSNPPVISNINQDGIWIFSITNKGQLTPDQYAALTILGKSTKSSNSLLRGEFGTGFILTLAPSITPCGVTVDFTCQGSNWRLEIKYPDGKYHDFEPLKTLIKCDGVVKNETTVTVKYQSESIQVNRYLEAISRASTRPIIINGILYDKKWSKQELTDHMHFGQSTNGDNEFLISTAPPFRWLSVDKISINVLDLPVIIEESAYHFITGFSTGGHMPQNESGHVFLDANEIIVNSNKLLLNSSRNSVVRDTAFYNMIQDLNVFGKGPLLEQQDKFIETRRSMIWYGADDYSFRENYRHQVMANIMTLSSKIKLLSTINSDLDVFLNILRYIVDRKVFATTMSDKADYSVSDIIFSSPKCILYDDELSDVSLEKMIRGVLIDDRQPIFINESLRFGGWRKYAISDVLKYSVSIRVVGLSQIVQSHATYSELIELGVLKKPQALEMDSIDKSQWESGWDEILSEVTALYSNILEDFVSLSNNQSIINIVFGKYSNSGIGKDGWVFMQCYSDITNGLRVRIDVNSDIFRKVVSFHDDTPKMKKGCLYLVSLMNYEFCYIINSMMTLTSFMKFKPESPEVLETMLNRKLISIIRSKVKKN